MAEDRNGSRLEKDNAEVDGKSKGKVREDAYTGSDSDDRKHRKYKRKKTIEDSDTSSDEDDRKPRKSDKAKQKSRKRRGRSDDSDSGSDSGSGSEYSDSEESEYSESGSGTEETESESEEERRRTKRKEKKRRRKREEERERRRRKKEKERKKRRKEKEERRRKEKEKRKKEKKKEKMERGKKGAVTNSWGKYGVIRETDMWNKRPEFTAWLAEVKQINLESLPNWEEKQIFKEFMEDHNTGTFPSKKYYDLDVYFKRKMEKEMKKGVKKIRETERTIFNDEEQRRQELLQAREKQKEEQVQALKHSMQTGMAQAMKEQAQLKEEMAYQYKLGNYEAAAAIQRRLDPDVPM